MTNAIQSIEVEGMTYTVGAAVTLSCQDGNTVGIIRSILPGGDPWDEGKDALVIEVQPYYWRRIAKPKSTYTIFNRHDEANSTIVCRASKYNVKPLGSTEDIVWKLAESLEEKSHLDQTIRDCFHHTDKATGEDVLQTLWYGIHRFGRKETIPRPEKKAAEPIYGWAAFDPDGSLGSFQATKRSLMTGYDLIPLRGLATCEQSLLKAGFTICKVKAEPLPLDHDGCYTALFDEQLNLDLLQWGGLRSQHLERQVMGATSRKKAGWEPGRINLTGFLDSLGGYLTQSGSIERYGWSYREHQDLRLIWWYPHSDDDRYKQRYEDLKARVKVAIAKRGITFAKVSITPCPDAPIPDEILENKLQAA